MERNCKTCWAAKSVPISTGPVATPCNRIERRCRLFTFAFCSLKDFTLYHPIFHIVEYVAKIRANCLPHTILFSPWAVVSPYSYIALLNTRSSTPSLVRLPFYLTSLFIGLYHGARNAHVNVNVSAARNGLYPDVKAVLSVHVKRMYVEVIPFIYMHSIYYFYGEFLCSWGDPFVHCSVFTVLCSFSMCSHTVTLRKLMACSVHSSSSCRLNTRGGSCEYITLGRNMHSTSAA